jgi:hypothetical protein
VRERAILFSAPMVLAILDGRKTQTRRVIRRPLKHAGWTEYVYFGPSKNDPQCPSMAIECGPDYPDDAGDKVICPFGAAGDRLWVRETWHCEGGEELVRYKASGDALHELKRWKSSMFMPRWASRIALEVTSVRVDRLQNISEVDAKAEGVCGIDWGHGMDYGGSACYVKPYQALWDQINAKRAPWASNPWVWVIEFRRAP